LASSVADEKVTLRGRTDDLASQNLVHVVHIDVAAGVDDALVFRCAEKLRGAAAAVEGEAGQLHRPVQLVPGA